MDGRVARGERNRAAMIDAALALTAENNSFPTAQMIAARAGVATRSVFHHFPDLDALFAAAAETQGDRYWSRLRPPEPGLPLEARLAVAVAQRAELFEAISPVRRVAALHEHESTALAARMADARAALRRHLRRALVPEITTLDRPTQAVLEAAASWEMWDVLRRHQGLSVAAATKAVTTMLDATLREGAPWAARSSS